MHDAESVIIRIHPRSYLDCVEDPFYPYRVLAARILLSAIDDLFSKDFLIQRQAKRYFEAKDDGPGSLEWICDALDINVDWVRGNLQRGIDKRENPLEKIRNDPAVTTYWGKPCQAEGHIHDGLTRRYIRNGQCVACWNERTRAYRRSRVDKVIQTADACA